MREILGNLGFRSTKEGARPAARVCPRRRRRVALGGGGYGGLQLLGFEVRDLCVLGGSPTPTYIGGGAGGQGEGGESLPNSAWVVRRLGEEGLPPQLGFNLLLLFPKLAV